MRSSPGLSTHIVEDTYSEESSTLRHTVAGIVSKINTYLAEKGAAKWDIPTKSRFHNWRGAWKRHIPFEGSNPGYSIPKLLSLNIWYRYRK
jgi:hypothetical protein